MLQNLAIEFCKNELVTTVQNNQVSIITGEPGCGKTTKLPQYLLDAGFTKSGIIACTEPKRIAAIAAATRIAEERNRKLGRQIGYQVRFESKVSKSTKLKFVTPGVLLLEASKDPLLSRYSCIIIDEAHERDIYTDVLLAYLKKICQQRSEFRLIILSATLNRQQFLDYFPGACSFVIAMRQFPVEISYRPSNGKTAVEMISPLVNAIYKRNIELKQKKDILIFLPGEREIREVISSINKLKHAQLLCLPLYGRLSPLEQRRIFMHYEGIKVICATNIAESSLTIDGVCYVIDTGVAKVTGFDSNRNIETLDLQPISQSEAIQRAGRAGRTQPGICIRLYKEEDFINRPYGKSSEIVRSDLTGLLLFLKALKLDNNFELLTPPSPKLLKHAEDQLRWFGAIEEDGALNDHGLDIASLPVEPKLAQFILSSEQFGCTFEAIIITAMLSVGRFFVDYSSDFELFEDTRNKFIDPESDFATLLNIWSYYEKSDFSDDWCQQNFLNPYWMAGVRSIVDQLIIRLSKPGLLLTSTSDREILGKAIFTAFRSFTLQRVKGNYYRTEDGKLSDIRLAGYSGVIPNQAEYVVSYIIERSDKLRAYCNQIISKEWLADFSMPQVLLETEEQKEAPGEDGLLAGFLKKSITELELTKSTIMKLWGIGVQTIQELIDKSEKELSKELAALLTPGSRQSGKTFGTNIIQEIEEQLSHFGLNLAPDRKMHGGFRVDRRIFSLANNATIDEGKIAQVLGDKFALLKQFQEGSTEEKIEARNELAATNLGLVTKWARLKYGDLLRIRDPSMDFDDLFQEGCIGLLRGIELFDYSRELRFSSYITWWIKQAVSRAINKRSTLPIHVQEQYRKFRKVYSQLEDELEHEPTIEDIAKGMGKPIEAIEELAQHGHFWNHFISLDEEFKNSRSNGSDEVGNLGIYLISNEPSVLDVMEESELVKVVGKMLDEVPLLDVERQCIELYFGINRRHAYTLDEIGGYLGVTRERIRQRIEKALGRFRTRRFWEMAKEHVKYLSAPATNQPSKVEIGDSSSKFLVVKGEIANLPNEAVEFIAESVPLNNVERQCFTLYFGVDCSRLTIAQMEKHLGISSYKILQHLDRVIEKSGWWSQIKKALSEGDSQNAWKAMNIINNVAKSYGFTSEEILSFNSERMVSRARALIIYRLRDELHLSFSKIGNMLNRDDVTVSQAHDKIRDEIRQGMMLHGFFPPNPKAVISQVEHPVQPDPAKRQLLSLNELLAQDISILGLSVELNTILRKKRKVNTVGELSNLGRGRLLMTEKMTEAFVMDIEGALKREGLSLTQGSVNVSLTNNTGSIGG